MKTKTYISQPYILHDLIWCRYLSLTYDNSKMSREMHFARFAYFASMQPMIWPVYTSNCNPPITT